MTTPQVTSEEIAKAREFLREVRAVCRRHGFSIMTSNGLLIVPRDEDYSEISCEHIHLYGAAQSIDLNEG